MTITYFRLLLPLALAACGVKVNGTSYGLGGSSSSSSSSSSGGSSGNPASDAPHVDTNTALAAGDQQCPVANGIADPYAGVEGETPKRIHNLISQRGPADMECNAANDHCVRQCMWLQVPQKDEVNTGIMTYFDEDLAVFDSFGPPWVAYRTVPATKRLLTPGAIVTFVKYPDKTATGGHGRYSSFWETGTLDRVDYKTGKVYLVGQREPGWLSTARVAVLEYREGGKVTIVGGRKRDQLAVKKDETFAPLADVAVNVDPWSEVAADGFPKAQSDDAPLEENGNCTAANNHCLRSWAWFAGSINADSVSVARWDGKQFLQYVGQLNAPAKTMPLDVEVAYRTIPAKKELLKKGMIVFTQSIIGGEEGAHGTWQMAKVLKVEDDRDVRVEDSYGREPTFTIARTRIAVVAWYPGDKAEKVEVSP